MDTHFEVQKKLATSGIDYSRKGSIDAKILDLSLFINNQNDYFTTSSCSGRIILFDDKTEGCNKVSNKQGCEWLFTSHDIINSSQIIPILSQITGDCVFKFEPFVLHVQCRTLDHAQSLLQCAIQSGFRNSGISLGKKGKMIVGVRSTHSMEVPLSHLGQLLVSSEYVEFLSKLANKKMEENFRRIDRFFDNIKSMIEHQTEDNKPKSCKKEKRYQSKNDEDHVDSYRLHDNPVPHDSMKAQEQSPIDVLEDEDLQFSSFFGDVT